MGYSSWSDDAYKHLSRGYASKSADDIFSRSADSDMLPNGIDVRESRDSDEHPNSLAVMVFLDVTGSMGRIPEIIVKEKLGALMNTIIDNGVPDPQILFGAIGDHHTDSTPLQLGQFESGTEELDEWLTKIYLEGGGGGQNMESYLLAWLAAGRHTSIDCFEKRNTKGFLFTIGDEKNWDSINSSRLKDLMGYPQSEDVTDVQLLEEAQRLYNVYHIHINEASYKDDPNVLGYWKKMLGERLIVLNDYNMVSETIATLIAVQHGADMANVVSKFDSNTADVVSNALAVVNNDITLKGDDNGVMKL
ncbi:MAG: hypothetical protein ACOC22_03235 [bacterium]